VSLAFDLSSVDEQGEKGRADESASFLRVGVAFSVGLGFVRDSLASFTCSIGSDQ
jgi:hypothetical protein